MAKKKKGGLFKKLFKRKPGGTFFGNLLRKAAHSFNPALGNGVMMLKEGESKEQSNDRIAEHLGNAAAGATVAEQATLAKDSFLDKIGMAGKNYVIYIIGGIITITALFFAFGRKKTA